VARAAVPGRLTVHRAWLPATLAGRRPETATAATLVLDVEGWPGHLAGQHVDVRLTAADGYQASRSYSVAAPAHGSRIEITVQRRAQGEVSRFLTDDLVVGDVVELRGPLGGWFVWRPEQLEPVLLVAGGSGIVPLMAMMRTRAAVSRAPFRLVYSVRAPDDQIYGAELRRRSEDDADLHIAWVHTRTAPAGDPRPPGRLRPGDLVANGWQPDAAPTCYICGPTAFVEVAAALLLAAGHDATRIRTERFGGPE
jgi:ferredoxin-NADP reductase